MNHEGQPQVGKVTKSSAAFNDVTNKNRGNKYKSVQVSATVVKDLGSDFGIIRGRISICKNERFAITPITDVSAACGS